MRLAVRNILASFALLGVFVLIDSIYVTTTSVTLEVLVVTPATGLAFLLVPVTFWVTNVGVCATKLRPKTYRLLLTMILSVVWYAAASVPFLLIHTAIGGRF